MSSIAPTVGSRLRADGAAVSDVVGSILLVGITVIMMTGLSVVVLSAPGPTEKVHAQVNVGLFPGADGQWGTGDESIRLVHRGGEPLPAAATVVILIVDASRSTFQGTALGGAFADGSFTIGEDHGFQRTITADSRVAVDVIVKGESDTLVTGQDLRTDMSGGGP